MNGFDRRLCDAAWRNGTHAIAAILIDTALIDAAHREHATAMLMLLGHTKPGARNSEALWRATKHRCGRCIELLAPASAPEARAVG